MNTSSRHGAGTVSGERCLVLGGKGFIGSHLVDGLLAHGYRVRCFDRAHIPPLSAATPPAGFELVEGDFTSESDVAAALEGCDVCFHLVSTTLPRSSNLDPVFDLETNLLPSVRLLRQAVQAGVRRVVFVSSGGTVYGRPNAVPIPETHPTDPLCSYGIAKLAIEKYMGLFADLHGLEGCVLRLSNPYGERQRANASQGAVAVFLARAMRGEEIEIWGDGSVVRDYLHISDVVAAMLAAVTYPGSERVFNIGSGKGTSINELLDAIERVTGRKTIRRYLECRSFDVPVNVLDIARARASLGWSPTIALDEGLARTCDWQRSRP